MTQSTLRFTLLLTIACTPLFCSGCFARSASPYEDGTYRGNYIDVDGVQVSVQFTLKEGVVTATRFRHLAWGKDFLLDTDVEPYRSVVDQYRETLDYLIGKEIQKHLAELYHPEKLIITQVDGYSGATLRSSKIISAIRDGLNRGVYSY